jgi:hypothetical protein
MSTDTENIKMRKRERTDGACGTELPRLNVVNLYSFQWFDPRTMFQTPMDKPNEEETEKG